MIRLMLLFLSYFDENNCYIRSECIIERVLQKIQFPRLCQRVTQDERTSHEVS